MDALSSEQVVVGEQAQVEVERNRAVSDQVALQDYSWTVITGVPVARSPWLDLIYDCDGYDALGNRDKGVIVAALDVGGDIPFRTITEAIVDLNLEVDGLARPGTVIEEAIDIEFLVLGDAYLIPPFNNFIKWSNIGEMNFTIGRGNVAGEMPMEWRGWIYKIKKLGSLVVVYGENGVAVLTPVGAPVVTFSRTLISNVGLLSKDAVAGTEAVHYFISKPGILWRLTPPASLEMLDYREFLSLMSNRTVLSYDVEKELLYICDGTYGYVLSKWGLGEGPVNISGAGRRTGGLYITAPGDVEVDKFEICTDILDFGSRDIKSIYNVELGMDTDVPVFVAVDYRYDKHVDFETTPWFRTTDQGEAFFTISGVEFRVRVMLLWYDYVELDYIKVRGKTVDKGGRPQ